MTSRPFAGKGAADMVFAKGLTTSRPQFRTATMAIAALPEECHPKPEPPSLWSTKPLCLFPPPATWNEYT